LGDENVSKRIAIAFGLSIALAGCANEVTGLNPQLATSALGSGGAVGVQPVGELPPHKKTMSDRVLTAIALERVTGLKPDPSRLVE
jgi:hypothetical protein